MSDDIKDQLQGVDTLINEESINSLVSASSLKTPVNLLQDWQDMVSVTLDSSLWSSQGTTSSNNTSIYTSISNTSNNTLSNSISTSNTISISTTGTNIYSLPTLQGITTLAVPTPVGSGFGGGTYVNWPNIVLDINLGEKHFSEYNFKLREGDSYHSFTQKEVETILKQYLVEKRILEDFPQIKQMEMEYKMALRLHDDTGLQKLEE